MRLIKTLLFLLLSFNTFAQRQFFVKGSLDPDAVTWNTNAAFTNAGLKMVNNQLVVDLKALNFWNDIVAAYSFVTDIVGNNVSSLNQAMLNLRNPLNTDAAFRIVFANNPTIDNTGLTWNGTTTLGDTRIRPNTAFPAGSLNSITIGLYIMTNVSEFRHDVSVTDFVTGTTFMQLGMLNSNLEFSLYGNPSVPDLSTAQGTTAKLIFGTRTASNALATYANGSLVASGTTVSTEFPTHQNIFLGAQNSGGAGGLFSTKKHGFVIFLKVGYNATRIADLSTIINKYQGGIEKVFGLAATTRKKY